MEKIPNKENKRSIFIEAGIRAPSEFMGDPFGYVDLHGKNIKKGEILIDIDGRVLENPNATRDLPEWEDSNGNKIGVVIKLVDTQKSEVRKSGDPIHELKVISRADDFGLPHARVLGRVEDGPRHMIIMQKIEGFRIIDTKELLSTLREVYGLTNIEIDSLREEAMAQMKDLEKKFTHAGIVRTWSLKDMIVQIDFNTKHVAAVIPVDWERAQIL